MGGLSIYSLNAIFSTSQLHFKNAEKIITIRNLLVILQTNVPKWLQFKCGNDFATLQTLQ